MNDVFSAFLLLSCVFACWASPAAADSEPPWRVAKQPWNERWGNHRAVVHVERPAEAVQVRLLWRRRDRNPEQKAVWVFDPQTGQRVGNAVAPVVTSEYGSVVFEATHAGDYHAYYMPFQTKGAAFPTTVYDKPETTASPQWLARHPLAGADAWRSLPAATVLAFEARTEWDRRDPMELPATAAETAALLEAHPERPFLLFSEDRRLPIRMTETIPARWAKQGPTEAFHGEAARNEFYVFQVGLFAARTALDELSVTFTDLRGPAGAVVPASAFRCFNCGGTDWLGRAFVKHVAVPRGHVQALWIGLDLPRELAPGRYEGAVAVAARGQSEQRVKLTLQVSRQVLEDRGDGDLWRLSRLRWLDSTLGLDDTVTRPYVPLKVSRATESTTVRCLGRQVTFGRGGLPTSLQVGQEPLLTEPVRLVIEENGQPQQLTLASVRVASQSEATVALESQAVGDGLTLTAKAKMEFDGFLAFQLTLSAKRDLRLSDCRLELPLRNRFATYLMGMGRKGGYRPDRLEWKWDVAHYQDSVWVGAVDGGLQLKLKGPNYRRPLGNIHYHRQPLRLPPAWHNDGKGGCVIAQQPADQQEGAVETPVVIRAYSGSRALAAGDELRFDFDLLLTPVKPLDPQAHWQQRYYHGGVPKPADAVAKGANLLNLHHGNELNPYLNYPFLTPGKLRQYVEEAHSLGAKVKLYYTVRELSNHAAELFALRSLGDEIYVGGDGGGQAWLCEHLVDGYAPAWHHRFAEGTWCCSLSQTGLSRWHNYYLEGLAWLCRNVGIDGLYLDEIGYDREIMKRVRRVLDANRPGALLDLHSWNHFNNRAGWANCLNLYLEHMPYLDSLWIGEGRNYNESPDYWLVEISGIPFGLFSEMLQGGGNPWRGMLYGMTNRLPWSGDPTPLWKLWDTFGIEQADMLGYWSPDCPVTTDHPGVLATVYRAPGKSLVCLASWEKSAVDCKLQFDWPALGLDPDRANLYAPDLAGLQTEDVFKPTEAIPLAPGRGWMFLVDETPRKLPEPEDVHTTRELLWEETFAGGELSADWKPVLSKRPGTSAAVKDGALTFSATANTCAFVERSLPPGVTLVECRLNSGTDGGQTWGLGLGLVFPQRFLRIHLRTVDRRYGYDDTGKVLFGPPAAPGQWHRVRIRLEPDRVLLEAAPEGPRLRYRTVGAFPRTRFPGPPTALRLGKMDAHGANHDFPQPGREGHCQATEVRVYRNR